MPKHKTAVPKLRRHVRGSMFVYLDGRQVWLGPEGDAVTHERYDGLVALWLANKRRLPVMPQAEPEAATVTVVVNEYRKHVEATCRMEHAKAIMRAVIHAHRLFGSTPAREFGPAKLEAVRTVWTERRLTRKTVNQNAQYVTRMFRWAASRELVPADVWHRLQTVEGVRRGMTSARESKRVGPVDDSLVDPIKPFVSRQVWALVELQRLTGARGGELFPICARDIDTSLEATRGVWLYRPRHHKTQDHGIDRVLVFNQKAIDVLREFITPERGTDGPLFSPREASRELKAKEAHCHRRPNQKPNPTKGAFRWKNPHGSGEREDTRRIGDTYDAASYRRAIQRACEKAFPIPAEFQPAKIDSPKKCLEKRDARLRWKREHDWHPHQLRHAWATKMRRMAGLETAQIGLGHTRPDMTLVYAERDLNKLIDAMTRSA